MELFTDSPEYCDESMQKPSLAEQARCEPEFWPTTSKKFGGWVWQLAQSHVPVSDEYYRQARAASAEKRFRDLELKWRLATGALSLVQQKVADMSYLQIIAMHEDALPFIFEQLQNGRRYWFVALEAITGERLVPNGATLQEAIAIWLQWGKQHGYL